MLEYMVGTSHGPRCVTLPGGKRLCYLGTEPLINGQTLASTMGLTAGVAINSAIPFLHFELNGKKLYMAQKPFRHTVSWNQLNSAGLVFPSKRITIAGKQYTVRLPQGGAATTTGVFDPAWGYGSEYNHLMIPIMGGIAGVSGEGLAYGTIAQLSSDDLAGNMYTICQDTTVVQPTWRTLRGGGGSLLYGHALTTDQMVGIYGWRPIIEPV